MTSPIDVPYALSYRSMATNPYVA